MSSTLRCCAIVLGLAFGLGAPASAGATTPLLLVVETQPAVGVSATGATLSAKVITDGSPTTTHFVYGSEEDHWERRTPEVSIPPGPAETPVTATISGLRGERHYYVRAVAKSDSNGLVTGDPVDLLTAPYLRLTSGPTTDITYTTATLHVTVANSRGATLTLNGFHQTQINPDANRVPLPPTTTTQDGEVAFPLTGLTPGTAYHWAVSTIGPDSRAVTNGDFQTQALSPMPAPRLSPASAVFGTRVTVSGTLPGWPGLAVTLNAQPFPFKAPPAAVPGATTSTDPQGGYRFDVRAERTTSYGVTAAAGFLEPGPAGLVRLKVLPELTVKVKRARHHRFVVSGRYRPDVPAQATLFRRGHGRAGVPVAAVSWRGGSRAFAFPARALKPGRYEVRLAVGKTAGVESTKSAKVTIPRR